MAFYRLLCYICGSDTTLFEDDKYIKCKECIDKEEQDRLNEENKE